MKIYIFDGEQPNSFNYGSVPVGLIFRTTRKLILMQLKFVGQILVNGSH